MMKKLVGIFLLLFFLFAVSLSARPSGVGFAWKQDLPTPNDLRGWKLYKGTIAGGPYVFISEIPFTTVQAEYTVTMNIDYPDGQKTKYFFVITAIDTSGNESGNSNEVAKEVDFLSPAAPKEFRSLN